MLNAPANQTIATPEGYEVTYASITPDIATLLLKANTNNRTVKARNLDKIGQDMLAGNWVFNGDAIRIDDAGVIIDGQHRLIQVVKTGVTIQALVVTGLPSSARATIDTNSLRSAADELKMQGYHNTPLLASVAGAYLRFHSYGLLRALDITLTGTSAISTSSILHAVKTEPLIEKLTKSSYSHTHKSLTATRGSILYWRFSLAEHSAGDADFFFARLKDGANLPLDSPIFHLRKALDQFQSKKHTKPSATLIAALTIKAWNAFEQGTPMSNLSFRTGGANPERFPAIG